LAEIAGGAQGIFDGLMADIRVAGDLVIERVGESRLRQRSIAEHERFKQLPARTSPLAFALQQTQSLGPQQQPRVLRENGHRIEPILMDHRVDTGTETRPRNRRGSRRVPCSAEVVREQGIAVVFLATAAEVSVELAPAMLEAGARVVDLSGAFRLCTAAQYAA